MQDVLYRVDNELLTLEQVNKKNLHEYTPVGVWLPALMGVGSYAYFKTIEQAQKALEDILYEDLLDKLRRLQEVGTTDIEDILFSLKIELEN